jgi:hypothetical protein
MYQYKVEKVTRLQGTNVVTAVLDLGFSVKMKVSFKLGRIEAPEFDFSSDVDPEVTVRNFIFQWFKTSPKPLYVQMDKNEDGVYIAEVLDRDGHNLADDLSGMLNPDTPIDSTQEIHLNGLPNATAGPGLS